MLKKVVKMLWLVKNKCLRNIWMVPKGITILIATPGRLIDHIGKTDCLSLKNIQWWVVIFCISKCMIKLLIQWNWSFLRALWKMRVKKSVNFSNYEKEEKCSLLCIDVLRYVQNKSFRLVNTYIISLVLHVFNGENTILP